MEVSGAYGESAGAAEGAADGTAGMTREIIILGHEAMNGNFSRIPGSIMVLMERMKATSLLLNPVTLGIGAIGAAAIVMGEAFSKGAEEEKKMDDALLMTGNYAGMTRGQMRGMAEDISSTGQITVGAAKDLVTTLVSSGQLGNEAMAKVASLAADYASITGEDVSKVGQQLVKIFDDPAKGAKELNDTWHILTGTEMDNIDQLGENGPGDGGADAARRQAWRSGSRIPKRIWAACSARGTP